MRNDQGDSESKLGLDRNRTVLEKLYRTLVLLLLAGFFGIFTILVVSLVTDAWAKFVAETVLEICWVFWGLAMIFVWWRPRWLRSHYLHAEHRMLRLGTVLKFAAAILFVVAVGLVTYLTWIGVLPLEPR